jgi:hypothetical protein
MAHHWGSGASDGPSLAPAHRLADGRVTSVQLMDSTWVRLDRVTT